MDVCSSVTPNPEVGHVNSPVPRHVSCERYVQERQLMLFNPRVFVSLCIGPPRQSSSPRTFGRLFTVAFHHGDFISLRVPGVPLWCS